MDASTLTNEELVAGGAILGGLLGTIIVCSIAFYVLMIVAMWKIFKKAGQAGWKSLIPIYNIYIYYKIAGMGGWFWGTIIIAFIGGFIAALLGAKVGDTGSLSVEESSMAGMITFIVTDLIIVIIAIMQCAKLSKAFGRGFGTTLGLIFFPNIFQLILAFGSAKYNKKALKK